jgi:hypothetical protein
MQRHLLVRGIDNGECDLADRFQGFCAALIMLTKIIFPGLDVNSKASAW